MKKLLLISFLLLSCQTVFAASSADIGSMQQESYVDTGNEKSIEITLSGTPGTVTTITLPSTAKGFRLFPRVNHVRFAVYRADSVRTIAAVATSSSQTIASSALAIGGVAKGDAWETRLLPPYDGTNNRILTLRSITGSVVIDLEVF